MSTQNRAQIDKFLTSVSNKIKPVGYVSELLLPMVPVVQYSGLVAEHGNDHLRIVNTVSGGQQGYPTVQSNVRRSNTYVIETHGLKSFLTKRDYANVDKPFDAEKDRIAKLTTHLFLGKEKSLADTLTDTAIITQNKTLAGVNQYNDYNNSDPIGDANEAVETIADATGMQPDTLTLSRKVFRTLRYHPKILEALGFTQQRAGSLSAEELAKALDIDRVLIAAAVFNDSVLGGADNIQPVWGKHMVYSISPRSQALEQVSLGYRMQIAGSAPRQVFKKEQDEPIGSMKLIVEDEYDQLLTNTGAAFLIEDAIL